MKKFTVIILLSLVFIAGIKPSQGKIMTVLVQPFTINGDLKFSWLAAGMTDTVVTDLCMFKEIRVITENDRKKALQELELAQTGLLDENSTKKVGLFLGADVILTGSVTLMGDKLRVNARIINIETSRIENTIKIDGTLESIFDVQDRIVLGLMENAGNINLAGVIKPKADKQGIKSLEDKIRPSLTAFELYSKGLELEYKDPSGALKLFSMAIDADPEYVQAYIISGYITGNVLNRFDDALGFLSKAEKLLSKNKKSGTVTYANVMNVTGSIYWSKGDSGEALSFYNKSIETREKLNLKNTAEYADTLDCIGIVYNGKGKIDSALEYYSRGKNIYDLLGLEKTVNYAILIMNMGSANLMKGNPDGAMKYYKQSEEICSKIGFTRNSSYANLMMNMGIVYANKGNSDMALEYFMKNKEILDSIGLQKTDGYAKIMNNIGLLHWSKGNSDLALEYFTKSKDIRDSLGIQKTTGYAGLIFNIAQVYEHKNDRKKAGEYYRKAYKIYEDAGYTGKARDDARKKAMEFAE